MTKKNARSTIVVNMKYDSSHKKLGSFSDIFRSEARNMLLLLFFLNPEKEYYVRGLEKKLGISVGNIRREILKLEKDNVVISRQMGNLKLYRVNRDNPLYPELRKIVLCSIGVQKLLSPFFSDNIYSAVFIYGSYARDEIDFLSDIDLFVAVDKELKISEYNKLNKRIGGLEEKIGREINLDLRTKSEFAKLKKEKNSYINDVLGSKKIFIKGGEDELRLLIGSQTKS